MSTEQTEAQSQEQAAAKAVPGFASIDFSDNDTLRQVTTMLRRVWLVDPPLSDEELAKPETVQECFRSLCESIGNGIQDDPVEAKWDQELWLKHTQLKLLHPPVRATAEPGKDLRSVVSPWREEVYEIYRHVFSDLWRALVQESIEQAALFGRFNPGRSDAVSLVALPSPPGGEVENKTAFRTDTFLYPVWVHPQAKVMFVANGEETQVWEAKSEATWTRGLWVRGGGEIVLTTEMGEKEKKADDAEEEEEMGISAVFVTGHCERRQGDDTEEDKLVKKQDEEKAPEEGAAAHGA